MAGGKVPVSGQGNILRGSVGDNSIQDAVFGTEGSLYSPLSALASNCEVDMIDTTNGGTRGVTPVKLTDFRGYPMPELSMNYTEETTGSLPCAYGENFYAEPTLKYSVGFNIKVTLSVAETPYSPPSLPDAADEVYSTKTFNFTAGNTTSTEGKTLVNTEAVSASQDVLMDVAPSVESFLSGGWVTGSVYYAEAQPYFATLEWTPAIAIGALTGIKASVSSISCSTDTSSFKLANSLTGLVWHIPNSSLANGHKCYFNNDCSGLIPAADNWFSYTTKPDGTPEYYWECYNGDGSVRNFTTCP